MTEGKLPRAMLAGVALIALATLLFEVVLTRIFAVTLWYYFGALSISLAMMGMAVAAVACYFAANRLGDAAQERALVWCALAMAALAPIAVAVHLKFPFVEYGVKDIGFYLVLAAQLVLLFLAFLAGGLCISLALYRYRAWIGTVYFSDLAGASIGSVLVVPLLFQLSGPAVVWVVSAMAALAALAFAPSRPLRLFAIAVALAGVGLAVGNDRLELLHVSAIKSYDLGTAQKREPHLVYERWSPLSRVAVFTTPKAPGSLTVTNDGTAPTHFRRLTGPIPSPELAAVVNNVGQAVHQLRKDARVLILGAGGGIDVASSLQHGQAHVTAVEINPVTAELALGEFAGYIGNLFTHPKVSFHVQEGRNFVAGTDAKFGIIQSNMVDSWGGAAAAAGAYVFSENSLYTFEAVRDYLGHLEPDGVLSISRHWFFDDALRLTSTFIGVLQERGLTDAPERLIVVAEVNGPYARATVLLKNGSFTAEESETIRRWCTGKMRLVWAPHVAPDALWGDPYAEVYRALIASSRSPATLAAFVDAYPLNIHPSTDDHPFHFFTTYLADTFDFRADEHPARRMALPILYGMFVVFFLFGVLTIYLPLRLSRRTDIHGVPHRLRVLAYFALLGMGYLLVEISLLHRLTVFLGHPTYSFVVVLTTMLFSSGVGSWVSDRWDPDGDAAKLMRVLLGILVVLLCYAVFLYDRFIGFMWMARGLRIALATLILVPPAFLMGMCFPMGMKSAQRLHPRLVPWGWGVNGAFSVFASVLSLVISLNLGLKAGLYLGALCYAVAYAVIAGLRRRGFGSAGSPPAP